MKKIIFKKDSEGWYADLPKNSREDNSMILGADAFLDSISPSRKTIKIYASADNKSNSFICKLIRAEHTNSGATYIITGKLAEQFGIVGNTCWLCNVTHQIFTEHPESIYIHRIL